MQTTSQQLSENVERILRRSRMKNSDEPLKSATALSKPALTIAISRERGAGGTVVSRMLGSRLDWPVYDRELIEKIASDAGVRTDLLATLDEKYRSSLAEWIESLIVGKMVTNLEFARHLTGTLSALAAEGQCIIVGRGAPVALPTTTTLRVRLIAPLEVRTERIATKYSVTQHEAARRIREADDQRYEFVQAHFSKDIRDIHLHDLVLNTARLSISQCAEVIIAALRQLEATPTD